MYCIPARKSLPDNSITGDVSDIDEEQLISGYTTEIITAPPNRRHPIEIITVPLSDDDLDRTN